MTRLRQEFLDHAKQVRIQAFRDRFEKFTRARQSELWRDHEEAKRKALEQVRKEEKRLMALYPDYGKD